MHDATTYELRRARWSTAWSQTRSFSTLRRSSCGVLAFVADTDFHPIFSGRCLFATFSGSRPVSAVLRAAIQGEKSTRTDSGSCLLFACVRLPSLGGCDHSRLSHLMLRSKQVPGSSERVTVERRTIKSVASPHTFQQLQEQGNRM